MPEDPINPNPYTNQPQQIPPAQPGYPPQPQQPAAYPTYSAAQQPAPVINPTLPGTVPNPTAYQQPAAIPQQPVAMPQTPAAIPQQPPVISGGMFNGPFTQPAAQPMGMVSAPMPGMPIYPEQGSSSKRTVVIVGSAVAGVIVLVIVGVLLYSLVFARGVSHADAVSAQATADKIYSDITEVNDNLELAVSENTDSQVTSDLTKATDGLSDAQKNYAILKGSHVMRDATVKQKFTVADKKWQPFIDYAAANAKDLQAMYPPILDYINQSTSLNENAPTDLSGYATFISQFKTLLDTTDSKLSSVKPSLPEDQQYLAAFETYLQSASAIFTTAQNDISAGKDQFAIYDDVSGIYSAESTFNDAIDAYDKAATAKQKQFDPSSELNALFEAINTLLIKTDK